MIVFIDTSTQMCRIGIYNAHETIWREWQADRELAKGLLGFIETVLVENGGTLATITGIGVYKGPGSFTGLRIGITVANTLADSLLVPIVGATGQNWSQDALDALKSRASDTIVLPEYGAQAHITKPRK